MRDKTSDTHRQDMPPCSLRSHCLRLADVLDGEQKALVDWQEEPLLKQLWDELSAEARVQTAGEAAQ